MLMAGPTAAHAQPTITEDGIEAGPASLVTFNVPHGCDGSATTELAFEMPEQIHDAIPTRDAFYDIEVVTEALDEPIEGENDEITDQVTEVIYTAETPLPDDQRDSFEIEIDVPDEALGDTLVFPVTQTCEDDEVVWDETAETAEEYAELDTPAPTVEVVAPGAGDDGTVPGDESPADAAGPEPGDSDALSWIALAVGILGLAFGTFALVRKRRTADNQG